MRLYVEGFSATCFFYISNRNFENRLGMLMEKYMLALYLFIKNKSNLSSKQAQKHSTHNANN